MDPTKYFEPIQKFTVYFLDRAAKAALVIFAFSLIFDTTLFNIAEIRDEYRDALDSVASFLQIKVDERSVFYFVFALFAINAFLELNHGLLRSLDLLSPVKFLHVERGEIFHHSTLIIWQSYKNELKFSELLQLHRLLKNRHYKETTTTFSNIFLDNAQSFASLLLMIIILVPDRYLAVEKGSLFLVLLGILVVGYIWESYRQSFEGGREQKAGNEAAIELIEKKNFQFSALSDDQKREIDIFLAAHRGYSSRGGVKIFFPYYYVFKNIIFFLAPRFRGKYTNIRVGLNYLVWRSGRDRVS